MSIELPATGTWVVEPTHTTVEAVAKHLRITKVRSRFNSFEGKIVVAEPITASTLEVTIDAGSFDSNNPDRDGHVKSADFLDVENHPTLEFRSTSIEDKGDGEFAVTGDLTIRGETKPLTMALTYGGLTQDPWDNTRALFSAEAKIDRREWGLTWNQALEAGGVLVSNDVKIEIETQLVQAG